MKRLTILLAAFAALAFLPADVRADDCCRYGGGYGAHVAPAGYWGGGYADSAPGYAYASHGVLDTGVFSGYRRVGLWRPRNSGYTGWTDSGQFFADTHGGFRGATWASPGLRASASTAGTMSPASFATSTDASGGANLGAQGTNLRASGTSGYYLNGQFHPGTFDGQVSGSMDAGSGR
jgi:hypothetical protein